MTDDNKPKKGEFYVLRPDVRGGGPGTNVVIENESALLTPPALIIRPAFGGIPSLPEKPRLVHGKGRNKPPRDLEGGFSGYWLVSERLKKVFEAVDPGAFQFAECDYVLPDGGQGPKHYLCEVVREIAALDVERSFFTTRPIYNHRLNQEIDAPDLSRSASLKFEKSHVSNAHIFRMEELPFVVICDGEMREHVRAAGIGLKPSSDGLNFSDAADL